MKFGKALSRNQIPEWSRHYLSYKGLKKEIKNGQEALVSGESSMDDVVTAFIFYLDREVEKVNNFFVYKRSELERRLRILSEKSRRLNPTISAATAAGTPAVPTSASAHAAICDPKTPSRPGSKERLDLSIVTTPKGSVSGVSGNASLVPPSPFISDPEADAECLQAMVDTKEMLSKLSWFAEMNRRAVEKILKKFDKRMVTVSREGYLATKISLLPFVFDGQLLEMTVTIDVLIREMRAVVADHPPFRSGLSPKRASIESRMGLTEQQIGDAMKAVERDDVDTLKAIIDTRLKEAPELKDVILSSAQSGRLGQLPRSLFRKACEEKAFRCITWIMSFGAGTLMVNVNEQTVLHRLAIEGGSFTKTTETSDNISEVQANGSKHHHQAPVLRDDPELIVFILKQLSTCAQQDPLCTLKSTGDIYGRRPLHYAAMHGFPNITRALINDLKSSGEFISFSDPYWFDTDGFTPLIYAVSRGKASVLEILVEEGGIQDVDAVTNAYVTHPSLPKVLPSMPKTVLNPLIGSEVNLHAVYTYTPLSIACRLGHVDAARLLVQFGANLNAQDEDGESCLIIASKNGHTECVRLLISGAGTGAGAGANLELRERYYGWTALHLAAIENHPEVVKVLLDAGANPNVYDYSSWNPHEHAVFAANNACAALLRPVSRTLDERQQLSKLNGGVELGQATPTKGSPSFTQPMLQGASGSQSPKFQRSDSPPMSSSKSNAKLSKTAQRAYGHKYLEEESLIVVTLGSNDSRSTVEPIELYLNGDSHSFLTASTAFSLEITAENATAGEKVIVDLPLKDSSYHEQIVFYAPNPEETILNFSVYPTFGSSSNNLVGRGTALLSSLDNLRKDVFNQHPAMTSLQGMNMTVPIFGVEKMNIIGRVRVEFAVVRPFKHENLKVGSKHTYWKSLTTTVIGHRGLGMNRKVSNLQVGENTLLSFVTAANLGAEYVEFDVQMTKDMVPVLYHDWTVTETGLDIPVSSITLEQFQNLSTKKRRGHHDSGSQPSSPKPDQPRNLSLAPPPSSASKSVLSKPELIRRSTHDSENDSVRENSPLTTRVVRSNSLGAMSKMKAISAGTEPANPAAKMKGNGLGTIQAPFATLKDTFVTVPTSIGFNIEVKYPMLDEAEDANIPLYSFEMNRFVDRILQEVYDHDQTHPDRNIIFSSFHPDICLLLNMKQPNYPVFFLTDGGTSVVADRRCNSIQGAVRFATSIDLLGIVTHSLPIIEAPNLVRGIKETGLLVFTYGADNNDVENAKLQRRHGVDAVIVDCLLAVRKGLQQSE
ncbi:Glycerophosphoryl diester phosphodiesterase family-domain-containing protein [Gamsiella multidivaricata]|uniref:Glycerophosphoryl diester phosphodiesterase family-domain-containing protein n=1 Tax=Gamsiella multidivaricata TaxID=101098 RepID=UPI00221F9AC2|nr:Glycerophosphoryl diester phosphodiesterase family-domain-containing protein [Gamsiella multidivaricata]KAG0363032.1 Glycerophosphocholine phosphodiesterase [Gamsiella multidivaricata]KAI7819138.1 Glycerophosphoryl diester phosphodiesterase family-domain-containing protein [Gamsiella multidivaricata]